ncbi:DUF4112 domain-containing protein [Nitratireductor luteus]|uniref:DUF4112 domain-containing protein n=1 Tax=Nitratireductor luteus TaxID=2976980 RepID=UPI0022406B22|nr:DUF4112 domain-containing protein [Nitratireductor luteus]
MQAGALDDRREAGRPVPDPRIENLDRLATLLDTRWGIPGTPFSFGIDGVASLLPVVGDGATALISAYIVYRAARLGAPRGLLLHMTANVGLDFAVGSVPVMGTVFDVFFKANKRNVSLLRQHLESEAG